jgi:hypothetical protein
VVDLAVAKHRASKTHHGLSLGEVFPAAITGDFVLVGEEANPMIKVLRS